jgi:hypothetical protein
MVTDHKIRRSLSFGMHREMKLFCSEDGHSSERCSDDCSFLKCTSLIPIHGFCGSISLCLNVQLAFFLLPIASCRTQPHKMLDLEVSDYSLFLKIRMQK